jgi:hypothetical protein
MRAAFYHFVILHQAIWQKKHENINTLERLKNQLGIGNRQK